MANIKKIKLKNAAGVESIYSIFDEGALRLNDDNKLITGNTIVDKLILEGDFYIAEVDDVAVTGYEKILVQDSSTGQIKGRSKDDLLEDIGGISYGMDSTNGVLSLQFGRQSE